ncbi:MAG TPA: M23 family metallopeptidase [Mucilaginibacter sp.]|jgi:murein DD-endopeptidase MepM/ murein hydrolase activator NlpD
MNLYLPLKILILTSLYGYRLHPVTGQYQFHNGIDLRANYDTVYAIAPGIAKANYDYLLGIYITVSDTALSCTYGHLSQILACGYVPAGTPIAITGATGRVTGPHLHFSIRYRGKPLDPLKFLYQLTQQQHEYQFQTAQRTNR